MSDADVQRSLGKIEGTIAAINTQLEKGDDKFTQLMEGINGISTTQTMFAGKVEQIVADAETTKGHVSELKVEVQALTTAHTQFKTIRWGFVLIWSGMITVLTVGGHWLINILKLTI